MAHEGSMPPPHVLRPSASDSRLGKSNSGRSLRSSGQMVAQTCLPGGGRSQGAVVPHPHYHNQSRGELAMARAGYQASRHGWYDPRGKAENTRLSCADRLPDGSAIPGSWTWMINKAHNHIGAGVTGILDGTDVCGTMVSGDAPDWFIGVRTMDGPFNCKAVPVRRCPKNYIEGKTLRVQARTYKQGDCLDVTDRIEDCSRLPTPERRRPRISEPHWKQDFKCYQVNGRAASRPATLVGGGCVIPATSTHASNMVMRDRFDPGSAAQAGKRHCDG